MITRRPFTLGLLSLGVGLAAGCSGGPARRGGATSAATLLPHAAWDCGLPQGIPVPEQGTLVFEAEVKLDAVYDVGRTPFGLRQAVVTQEGTLKGPRISGEVLAGGLDYQLVLANGVVEVEQILVLRTSDGKYVLLRNAGTGPDGNDLRIVYDFEASSDGEFAWLNTGTFVGRRSIDRNAGTMRFSVYDVSAVNAAGAPVVRIGKPAGVPPQPRDYRHADPSEQRGEEILVETVTLGRSQAIQSGKRGNRNIIPITGGTVKGLINGKVVFGGADYQSFGGGGPPIDARYMWQAEDGEIVIVRNTTNPGIGLVPTFEARVDGPFAWMNSGKYLSSNPGMANGGVSISMYRSR